MILNSSDLAAAAALAGTDKLDVFQGSDVPKSTDLAALAAFVLGRKQLVAIADDTAVETSLGGAVNGAFLLFFGEVSTVPRGICWMRCAASPAIASLVHTGTVAFSTTALAGTTGADASLNIAARNGSFIVENRTGGAITLSTLFLKGGA